MNAKGHADIEAAQRTICREQNVIFTPAYPLVNSGFASATIGKTPLNGLRHPPSADTTGWYLWFGEEFSTRADFFEPLHTTHLYEQYPEIENLLGLPAGYRFLISGAHRDIWFDANLLNL
ncbi:MAG: hypothetical protein V4555_11900 [Acidobacteriota bacterium]